MGCTCFPCCSYLHNKSQIFVKTFKKLTPAAGLWPSRIHKYDTIPWSSADPEPSKVIELFGSTRTCFPPACAWGGLLFSSHKNSREGFAFKTCDMSLPIHPHCNCTWWLQTITEPHVKATGKGWVGIQNLALSMLQLRRKIFFQKALWDILFTVSQ